MSLGAGDKRGDRSRMNYLWEGGGSWAREIAETLRYRRFLEIPWYWLSFNIFFFINTKYIYIRQRQAAIYSSFFPSLNLWGHCWEISDFGMSALYCGGHWRKEQRDIDWFGWERRRGWGYRLHFISNLILLRKILSYSSENLIYVQIFWSTLN